MRNYLVISSIFLSATSTYAADMIFETTPVPYIEQLPFSWSGTYVGANLGYGWSEPFENELTPGLPSGIFSEKAENMFGGVYLGAGKQARRIYFGVETDLQYSGLKGTYASDTGLTGEYGMTWFGSTRVRVGYPTDPHALDIGHIMPYVTAGLAYGKFKAKMIDGPIEWLASRSDSGYVLGAGVDFALNNNTIAKLEYQYMDFGTRHFTSDLDSATLGFKAHTVRAGIAYKF